MQIYIRLWEHVGLGLIISWPSGITYMNQTGGAFCLVSELEGIFISVRNEVLEPSLQLQSPAIELAELFRAKSKKAKPHWLDDTEADKIDSILKDERLYPVLRVDRSLLRESHEAWIWVEVTKDENDLLPIFSGFSNFPLSGVLTWENSD